MLSISIALVGRSNVGKSTLFNRLTRTRNAIVGATAGLTRDRHYGKAVHNSKSLIIIDTGGWERFDAKSIGSAMVKQTELAIIDADFVFFIVDARSGLMPRDEEIANKLHKLGKKVKLVINKGDGLDEYLTSAEFGCLGYEDPTVISAMHGDGVSELMDIVATEGPSFELVDEEKKKTKIAIVGKPNVGKSTLINGLVGEDRVITRDDPGTTRDSIFVDFSHGNHDYLLIDTAGIRRKAKVTDIIEKFSVIKTLRNIDGSDVVVLMVDATDNVSDQDAKIGGYIIESGRALVIAINKWDKIRRRDQDHYKMMLSERLKFLSFSKTSYISALTGKGIPDLLKNIRQAHRSSITRLSSSRLNRALRDAVVKQSPPISGRYRPKLKFAHQGGVNPPRFIIYGNGLNKLSGSYRRFLENYFIDTFSLQGTPVRLVFRSSNNPYV